MKVNYTKEIISQLWQAVVFISQTSAEESEQI